MMILITSVYYAILISRALFAIIGICGNTIFHLLRISFLTMDLGASSPVQIKKAKVDNTEESSRMSLEEVAKLLKVVAKLALHTEQTARLLKGILVDLAPAAAPAAK